MQHVASEHVGRIGLEVSDALRHVAIRQPEERAYNAIVLPVRLSLVAIERADVPVVHDQAGVHQRREDPQQQRGIIGRPAGAGGKPARRLRQLAAEAAVHRPHASGRAHRARSVSKDDRVQDLARAAQTRMRVAEGLGRGKESGERDWMGRLHQQRPRAGERHDLVAVDQADDRRIVEVAVAHLRLSRARLTFLKRQPGSPVGVDAVERLGLEQRLR
jgi:hypothetical protein